MKHNILLDDIELNRKEFIELHGPVDYYGGSKVANICGVGYDSPLKQWLRDTGKLPPIETTDQMKLGSFLEPLTRTMLSKRINAPVKDVNQVWQSKERPWMIYSPDATIGFDDEFLGEGKVHKLYADKYWSEDSASDSAMCQLQWGLALTGMEGGYCYALIGGDTDKFYYPFFEADKELQAQLIDQVEKFRELVKSDMPPDAGADDAKLIKEHLLAEYDKERRIDLTESHSAKIAKYRKLAEETDKLLTQAKPMQDEMKAIKNQFSADSTGAGTIKVGRDEVRITKVVRKPSVTKGSEFLKVTIRLEDQ